MTDIATRSPVDLMADAFWEYFLERQPIYASIIGDHRYDDRLGDPGPAGRASDRRVLSGVLRDAAALDRDGLGVEDRITLEMLETVARVHLAELEQNLHEFDSLDHINGPQTLVNDLARYTQIETDDDFEHLLARLAAYPAYLEAHIANLREGIASGRTAAPIVAERTVEQLERMVVQPAAEAPLLTALAGLSAAQETRLEAAIVRDVLPSQVSFLEFVRAYLPHVRAGAGVCFLPDGEAVYATAILASTTLPLGAQELHDFGLEQLAMLDGERLEIARALGHADVAALRDALAHDPGNFARKPSDLVDLARQQIERATALAPRAFGRLPRAACQVRAVEPYMEREAPTAFYLQPAPDGSRPGTYFINTFQPESRPLHQLAAITYHEAVPGHHFQCSIETELDDLHPFRRFGSRLAGIAYTEGWGLYSERLADEMGLYLDPRERLGMLDMQAMRAGRLITDTGLHAFGWDRLRAIDVLEATGLSRLQSEVEIDRYTVWPGQALAYMVGQRELMNLRRELAARDGAAFDLPAFHDQLLGHGALPLAILRSQLPAWVRPRGA
ncbi:MAG: DUF885 domain-containing protein [Candidatus Limnocylindrales bacterium]